MVPHSPISVTFMNSLRHRRDAFRRVILPGVAAAMIFVPTNVAHSENRNPIPAPPCEFEPIGIVTARSASDGRTFALTDGREVRLAGIEVPVPWCGGRSMFRQSAAAPVRQSGARSTDRGQDGDVQRQRAKNRPIRPALCLCSGNEGGRAAIGPARTDRAGLCPGQRTDRYRPPAGKNSSRSNTGRARPSLACGGNRIMNCGRRKTLARSWPTRDDFPLSRAKSCRFAKAAPRSM